MKPSDRVANPPLCLLSLLNSPSFPCEPSEDSGEDPDRRFSHAGLLDSQFNSSKLAQVFSFRPNFCFVLTHTSELAQHSSLCRRAGEGCEPVHHLSPGPPRPPCCINNADMTKLIGGDNRCLGGANPKECSVSTHELCSLLHLMQTFSCCTSFFVVELCHPECTPAAAAAATAAQHSQIHTHSVIGKRHTFCWWIHRFFFFLGRLALLLLALFLWLLIHRSKGEVSSAFTS